MSAAKASSGCRSLGEEHPCRYLVVPDTKGRSWQADSRGSGPFCMSGPNAGRSPATPAEQLNSSTRIGARPTGRGTGLQNRRRGFDSLRPCYIAEDPTGTGPGLAQKAGPRGTGLTVTGPWGHLSRPIQVNTTGGGHADGGELNSGQQERSQTHRRNSAAVEPTLRPHSGAPRSSHAGEPSGRPAPA